MIRNTVLIVLLALAVPSFGAPVEVACHWDEVMRYRGSTSTLLESLYGKTAEPAYFNIDAEAGIVSHSDPNNAQAALLPKLNLFGTREKVKIIAPSPNVPGLQNTHSALEITIDRYTLESTMVLAMPSSTPDVMAAHWSRSGRCVARQL